MVPLAVIVPTFQERLNIDRCIRSVAGWAEEVYVVDSGSTDGTQEMAKGLGSIVVEHAYLGPAEQKNWALECLHIRAPWVLFLDADEQVTPELRSEIQRTLAEDGSGHDGFYVNRRYMFAGRWLRHVWYPSWNLRLIRKGKGRYELRRVHEHVILDGPAGYLSADLLHEDHRGVGHLLEKHVRYAASEAAEAASVSPGPDALPARLLGSPVERRRWLKRHVWYRLPFRYGAKFLYLYVIRRGFLDGVPGFYFCLLQSLYEMAIALQLWELRSSPDRAEPTEGPTHPARGVDQGPA